MIELKDIKVVSEFELAAVEAAIRAKIGDNCVTKSGAAGNSPYSEETIVFADAKAADRGARIKLVAVCRSHDGAGRYKGRGRWRSVYIAGIADNGDLATCVAGDRESEEVGYSGFYVRPWAVNECEEKTNGLGVAFDAVANAFADLGL